MIKYHLFAAALLLTACSASGPVINNDLPASSASSASSETALLPALNETGLPLELPAGFHAQTLADGMAGARVAVHDMFGNFWVSRPAAGVITHLEMSGSTVLTQNDTIRGLRNPHGLAIDPANGLDLYIAEETSVKRARLYSDAPIETIAQLPAGGRHTSRTIQIGADGRLWVSIGSTCDVCVEANELHGTIISMNKDGSDQRIEATGLRNAVFFTAHPATGAFWATEMGRDQLGDNLPPEEVNIIASGGDYGWPFCYGDRVRDETFRPTSDVDCGLTVAPHLTLPAHIAPLGLAFIPAEEPWPRAYWHDLLVAQHGSWNSTVPVGYKIVRIPLDAQGNREGETADFITGFRSSTGVEGRPVDLSTSGGTLFITDDRAGAAYRVMVRTAE